jgi:negative regulator of flagellin synthesis FlgM
MKITEHQTIPKIVKLPENRAAETLPEKTSSAHGGHDRVSLSPQARELLKAQQSLAALPDVREDKVSEIKARVDGGRYHIDSEAIAAKMIREAFPEDE